MTTKKKLHYDAVLAMARDPKIELTLVQLRRLLTDSGALAGRAKTDAFYSPTRSLSPRRQQPMPLPGAPSFADL